jgi:hypothetical protein
MRAWGRAGWAGRTAPGRAIRRGGVPPVMKNRLHGAGRMGKVFYYMENHLMTNACRTVLLAAVGGLLAAGCATPAHRIKQNPELFASFPPAAQENVRQGRIEVGYTKDMVRIALGRPGRVAVRTTQSGTAEIWIYTSVEYRTAFEPGGGGYWYRDRAGRLRHVAAWAGLGVQERHENDLVRVEFDGNTVTAIEILR